MLEDAASSSTSVPKIMVSLCDNSANFRSVSAASLRAGKLFTTHVDVTWGGAVDVPNSMENALYGDLDLSRSVDSDLIALNQALQERAERAESEAAELRAQVSKLDEELRKSKEETRVLKKQRQVLLHNLSVLFKTAELEIARKRKEIERLRSADARKAVQ
ncbi:hypothetical protein FVE85_4981 [Porphyridium purpureum]|uniref:Uncharacterized protein n=1 Tax=Porphyridium purpureum TaxID=35688 RepID=A0A5J4YSW8_PORPP|nr:hypothetical protein FVE85_4981 [Porphyridium purpureum]|eukprot:POR9624..scf236_6